MMMNTVHCAHGWRLVLTMHLVVSLSLRKAQEVLISVQRPSATYHDVQQQEFTAYQDPLLGELGYPVSQGETGQSGNQCMHDDLSKFTINIWRNMCLHISTHPYPQYTGKHISITGYMQSKLWTHVSRFIQNIDNGYIQTPTIRLMTIPLLT